ncbi:MAG: hypothetical protein K0S47_2109 [Herbinix sp.]|jgi:tetratricopeptide (TPR) repeat protein|nr:hypothetical protein [Herbinix sp.]
MGKVILCSGERTSKPYLFATEGIRVYSMEELCYYIYHHIYYITADMFTNALIEWIGTECKLKDRADKLKVLKDKKADVKSLATVVLCSTDYYTEDEIKSLLKIMDQMAGMSKIMRECFLAEKCVLEKNYQDAIKRYEQILKSEDAKSLHPKEYGDLLHNLAVAKINTAGLNEAVDILKEAYLQNRNVETLKQYLLAMELSDPTSLVEEEIQNLQVEAQLLEDITKKLDQLYEEADNCEMMMSIHQLNELKKEGKITDFYKKIDDIIDSWKQSLYIR